MALPNDMSRIAEGLAKLEGSNDASYTDTPKEAARTLIRRSFVFPTTAVNANGNNVIVSNATTAIRMLSNGRVLGAYFVPQGAATASATDYALIAVHKLSGNGGTGTSVASITTKPTANSGSGNLVKATTVSMVVDSAAYRFTKGALIAPDISMVSSGVALPAGSITVDVELEGAATDYPV